MNRFFSRPRPTLVETVVKCFQDRFLLRADERLNARLLGCLAKAQQEYDVELHGFVCLSNHLHILASYEDPQHMADFHRHLNGNLSKEVGKLRDWRGALFSGRYGHVEISDEPEAQWQRLKYLLSQGCKEGLVASPLDWPGASSVTSMVSGEPLVGEWIDRTALHRARQRGEDVSERDFVEYLEVTLRPIPSLAHLSEAEYRRVVLALVGQIEEETAAMHHENGTRPAGAAAVLSRDPLGCPAERKPRRSRPWFHAVAPEVRETMRAAMIYMVVAYREAASRLKGGDRLVEFPLHTFPPGLPFVKRMVPLEDIVTLKPG